MSSNNRLQLKPRQPQPPPPVYDIYRMPNVVYYVRPSLKQRMLRAGLLLALAGCLLGGIWYVVFGRAVDCDASAYNCLNR